MLDGYPGAKDNLGRKGIRGKKIRFYFFWSSFSIVSLFKDTLSKSSIK
jgi:hypothetical protein